MPNVYYSGHFYDAQKKRCLDMNLISLGHTLRLTRKQKRLSKVKLAQKTGLSRSLLTKVEAGRQNITLTTLMKIVEGLSTTFEDIFALTDMQGKDVLCGRQNVIFLKLGGTWDMRLGDRGLVGRGFLDDQEFAELEKQSKGDESVLVRLLEEKIKLHLATDINGREVGSYLTWVPDIKRVIKGPFITLFSGDSSHYRHSLLAVILSCILKQAKARPNTTLLMGLGTDTTDLILPLLDTLFFDKDIQPMFVTGANRSYFEPNSDAPDNFVDLAYAAHLPLKQGAYYVFHHTLYRGGDVKKIDPREEPQAIEGMLTFFAPHRTQMKLGMIESNYDAVSTQAHGGSDVKTWPADKIFLQLQKIVTVNLGHLNDTAMEIKRILNPRYSAVIIETHALGNVSNPIRQAISQALNQKKLVVIVSRCVVGDINDRYAASILNEKGLVNGKKLSAATTKGILLRALLEKLTSAETQKLVDDYLQSLGLT